jgi:hypothetical protein
MNPVQLAACLLVWTWIVVVLYVVVQGDNLLLQYLCIQTGCAARIIQESQAF